MNFLKTNYNKILYVLGGLAFYTNLMAGDLKWSAITGIGLALIYAIENKMKYPFMILSAAIFMLLFTAQANAATISSSVNFTYHFEKNDLYNDIGDERTTVNRSVRLGLGDYSLFIFNDSFNSTALGATKKFFKKDILWDRAEVGLELGVYATNKVEWDRKGVDTGFPSLGSVYLVPVVAPYLAIDLYRGEGWKIQSHSFVNGPVYFSSGLLFVKEF